MSKRKSAGLMDLRDVVSRFNEIHKLRESGADVEAGVVLPDGTILHNPVVRKVLSADKWKKRQIDRATAARDDWLDGVKNPSRDPIEAGIAADKKWRDKLEIAMKEDRRVKGLRKSSHAEIVDVVTKLGAGVFSDGITARDTKIGRVVGELQPLAQSVSDAIQAMPDATDVDREKRLLSARKLMIEVGKKRRG